MTQANIKDSIAIKYEAYGRMLYKLSYLLLCNKNDAEDAVQDTFMKYMQKPPRVTSAEHEKAWFVRVATNVCRDRQRFRFRRKVVSLSQAESNAVTSEDTGVLREVLSLPEKSKTPVYLHYYEGYSIQEIAWMLESSESAVKTWLFRGRQKLKLRL